MKLLLDTQILLWWLEDEQRVPAKVAKAIASRDNRVLVSVVSLWEIVIKVRVGKLEAEIERIESAISSAGIERLPIMPSHLREVAILPKFHKDPFDHLLLAQAKIEGAKVVSVDRAFRAYSVDIF